MTPPEKMRMIILSASGSGRKRTIPALKDSDKISIVAIHGRNEEKTKAIALEYGIPHWYTDIEQLLNNEKFDFGYVASPPFLHKEQIIRLAKTKKPIICEKPLCITLEDAITISQAVQSENILFRLAHHVRHQKAMDDIKDLLASAAIGEIRFAFMQWSFNLNRKASNATWKLDPKLGGRHSFFDAGVHAIDLALYFFGCPTHILANGVPTFSESTLDSSVVVFGYPTFNIVIAASLDQVPTGNDLLIYGNHGSIRAPGALNEASIGKLEVRIKDHVDIRQYPPQNLYQAEVYDFAAMIMRDQPFRDTGTTLDEAILATRILDRISESIDSGCRVRI